MTWTTRWFPLLPVGFKRPGIPRPVRNLFHATLLDAVMEASGCKLDAATVHAKLSEAAPLCLQSTYGETTLLQLRQTLGDPRTHLDPARHLVALERVFGTSIVVYRKALATGELTPLPLRAYADVYMDRPVFEHKLAIVMHAQDVWQVVPSGAFSPCSSSSLSTDMLLHIETAAMCSPLLAVVRHERPAAHALCQYVDGFGRVRAVLFQDGNFEDGLFMHTDAHIHTEPWTDPDWFTRMVPPENVPQPVLFNRADKFIEQFLATRQYVTLGRVAIKQRNENLNAPRVSVVHKFKNKYERTFTPYVLSSSQTLVTFSKSRVRSEKKLMCKVK
jgi:hypothetical protein